MKNILMLIILICLSITTNAFCYDFSKEARETDVVKFSGRVVGVADGDTITVMRDGEGVKIRLYGIDAPEKKQPYGQAAKKFLSDMVAGKTVEVIEKVKDRYMRTVGIVTLNGTCVNSEIIRSGLAWVYDKYCTNNDLCLLWDDLSKEAQKKRRGLWSDSEQIPPWEFRRNRREVSK